MNTFRGKTVLVIGGTGSLGRVLVERILKLGPKKIVIMSRDEEKHYQMKRAYKDKRLVFRIGDVRNYEDVCSAVKNANIVIHAAAMKQVPICEYYPVQTLLTNCVGAANIVRAIEEHSYPVEVVLAVSSDKACNPINVMGMAKAIQEKIMIAANVNNPNTKFVCIRCANFEASRGSVVPLFLSQIEAGGPVTVTDDKMFRYFMTLNQVVDMAFEAISHARPGEIYVPEVTSQNIYNLAKKLILESGKKVDVKIIGIRPGEKLSEELISEQENSHTIKRGDYFVITPLMPELTGRSS